MQPRPCFSGRYVAPIKMACRSGPARIGEAAPLRAFSLGQINKRVARKHHRRLTVGLRAKERVMLVRPCRQRVKIIFIDKFAERLAPVMPYASRQIIRACKQFRQIRCQIIAATFLKLSQKIRCPVRAIDLQAVTKDRVWWLVSKGLHQLFARILQMVLNGCTVKVIEHESLSADRGTFYLLSGAAADEKQHDAIRIDWSQR